MFDSKVHSSHNFLFRFCFLFSVEKNRGYYSVGGSLKSNIFVCENLIFISDLTLRMCSVQSKAYCRLCQCSFKIICMFLSDSLLYDSGSVNLMNLFDAPLLLENLRRVPSTYLRPQRRLHCQRLFPPLFPQLCLAAQTHSSFKISFSFLS